VGSGHEGLKERSPGVESWLVCRIEPQKPDTHAKSPALKRISQALLLD